MKRWQRNALEWLGWRLNRWSAWCLRKSEQTPDWIVGHNRPPERYENGEF